MHCKALLHWLRQRKVFESRLLGLEESELLPENRSKQIELKVARQRLSKKKEQRKMQLPIANKQGKRPSLVAIIYFGTNDLNFPRYQMVWLKFVVKTQPVYLFIFNFIGL